MARDHRRLAAIVSFDVAGYSRLMGVDDSGTLAALKAHRRELIDPKIAEHDGRIVKTTGDGLLLEFSSVVDAVRCAVEVQRGMAERNAGVAPDKRLDFRIGINVGDIIIDGDDIFGDGVNVAARLEALADPGGICVSRVVRDQVLDKLSFAFEDLGAQEVKNIARPVDVYRVSLDAGASAPTVPKPEQRPAPLSKQRWRPAHALVAVAVALVVGLGAWTAYRAFLQPAVVAPYSAQDRRMTFAVLPFQAPADDKEGAQVAAAMTEAAFAVEEGKVRVGSGGAAPQRRTSLDAAYRHQGSGRGPQRALSASGQRDARCLGLQRGDAGGRCRHGARARHQVPDHCSRCPHAAPARGPQWRTRLADLQRARRRKSSAPETSPSKHWTCATCRFGRMSIGATRRSRKTKRAPISPPRTC